MLQSLLYRRLIIIIVEIADVERNGRRIVLLGEEGGAERGGPLLQFLTR